MPKRYKISLNNGEYRKDTESELPLAIRECIEKLIDVGESSGTIDIPGFRCEFSVCPEQCFPGDMIAGIYWMSTKLRAMVKMIKEIDSIQFRQTIVTIRECADVLASAAIREHERNQVLNGDRMNTESEPKSESGAASLLCPFHASGKTGYTSYLNPDCPECERILDIESGRKTKSNND